MLVGEAHAIIVHTIQGEETETKEAEWLARSRDSNSEIRTDTLRFCLRVLHYYMEVAVSLWLLSRQKD